MLLEANLTSRALIAALGVCLVASASAAAQGNLPPPPYAVQSGQPDAESRPVASLFDRYGGGAAHVPIARAVDPQSTPETANSGPRLSWSGKTVEAAAPQPRAAYRAPYDAPPNGRLQYPSMAAAATAPAPTPQAYTPAPYNPPMRPADARSASIYDPAPPLAAAPMPPPVRQAAAGPGEGPRFYSLHRDYGLQPDPIPLAPQFFGPTADLTTPETPEVGRRTRTSTGAYVNAPTDAGGAQ